MEERGVPHFLDEIPIVDKHGFSHGKITGSSSRTKHLTQTNP